MTDPAVNAEEHPALRADSISSASDDWELNSFSDLKRIAGKARRHAPEAVKQYVQGLFPILTWIPHYKPSWAPADFLAGFTIGLVVVPQSLAYAKVAQLPAEYGLYSSFVGVLFYALFATSKDMTIGPTAVMALTVGQVISRVNADGSLSNVAVATTYSMIAGLIMLGIGLFRLGFLVDFIPLSVISGFTTGGAITVIIGQIPAFFGITGVDTRQENWKVIRDVCGAVGRTRWPDAVLGFSAAFVLLALKYIARRNPKSKTFWYLGVARSAIVAILATIVSFIANKDVPRSPVFAILKDVPSGFNYVAVPSLDTKLVSKIADGLPVIVLIGLLEHIAIAKSFGRINGYKINPSQEVVAIGVTNVAASFFGAFPSTGSFSRSAIKSQSGVKTPLAGIVTALVVVLAIFFLSPTFYWIPNAALAAIIMHGVAELFSPPSHFIRLWKMNKLDFVTAMITIALTVVFTVELGIEIGVAVAVVFLLWRLAKPKYQILAKAAGAARYYVTLRDKHHHDSVIAPPPGVLIFRIDESLTYPNAGFVRDNIYDVIVSTTRRGVQSDGTGREAHWNEYAVTDRAKNDSHYRWLIGPIVNSWTGSSDSISTSTLDATEAAKDTTVQFAEPNHGRQPPLLNTIILDYSAVNNIDATGVQMVLDLKLDASRYAGQDVQFHFVHARAHIQRVFEEQGITNPSSGFPVVVDDAIPNKNIDGTTSTNDITRGLSGDLRAMEENLSRSREAKMQDYGLASDFFHANIEDAVEFSQRRRNLALKRLGLTEQ